MFKVIKKKVMPDGANFPAPTAVWFRRRFS